MHYQTYRGRSVLRNHATPRPIKSEELTSRPSPLHNAIAQLLPKTRPRPELIGASGCRFTDKDVQNAFFLLVLRSIHPFWD